MGMGCRNGMETNGCGWDWGEVGGGASTGADV